MRHLRTRLLAVYEEEKSCGVIIGPPGLLVGISLILLLWARVSIGLEHRVVTQDGSSPSDGSFAHVYQGVELGIHNQMAAGKHSYQFKNKGKEQLEMTAVFELAPQELVDGFSYWNGAERIVGEVLEKEAATRVYEELTGVNRDPGILEQVGQKFRFRVFPLEAGELKPVEVNTVVPLELRDGQVKYSIPLSNVPQGTVVFSFKADITDDLPIEDVETVGFKGVIKRFGAHHVRVVYEGEGSALKGPLFVKYRLRSIDHSMRFATHRTAGEDGTFVLLVSPKDMPAREEVIGRDIVFVLDRSGSMCGEPLEQTKRALEYILERLNPDDRFDVVAFDDENQVFFGKLKPASAANTAPAIEKTRDLLSGGGTNIKDALIKATELLNAEQSNRPKAIIFLTDGQGNNPPEVVLSEFKKKAKGVRLFGFGAGSGVNRQFLERLARDNRGVAVFIHQSNQIEQSMKNLYDKISMPLMIDLKLDFGGMNVHSVYPKVIPDLYADGQVAVFGRFAGARKGTIRLKGRVKGKHHTIALNVQLPKVETKKAYIEKLWASRRIDHLMETISKRSGKVDELEQEVTRLGIVYNLVTPFTTFLAVPESLKTAEIKEMIKSGKRGYDKRLVDSMEGIRMSMRDIPPGDPVLSVSASEDAKMVVAYFPFGLIKPMAWDPHRKHWSVRFLVPRDTKDGSYEALVQIVTVGGEIQWRRIEYRIDGTAPEIEADVPASAKIGEFITIEVDPFEPVKEVSVCLQNKANACFEGTVDPETGLYKIELQIPEDWAQDSLELRVIVRDRARNRFEKAFSVRIIED